MKLSVEEIGQNAQYKIITSFGNADLIEFISPYLSKTSPWTLFYWFFNLFIVSFLALKIIFETKIGFDDAIMFALLGFPAILGLIPLHELIHGWVYQYLGAKNVKYKVVWHKFMFLTVADKFVVNRQEFTRVAIAPFLVISFLLIILYFWLDGRAAYLVLGALLMHTGACSGDFALINYFYIHRQRQLYTYDEVQNEITYIVEQIS
jgi:hypothetical protein